MNQYMIVALNTNKAYEVAEEAKTFKAAQEAHARLKAKTGDALIYLAKSWTPEIIERLNADNSPNTEDKKGADRGSKIYIRDEALEAALLKRYREFVDPLFDPTVEFDRKWAR